ncbi:hypothetical protein Q1695_002167 [Nippostrongylus brasiliensis]|nr:hypothetical protein Q1695_002167 [Nippostrongylus brasiliensis]
MGASSNGTVSIASFVENGDALPQKTMSDFTVEEKSTAEKRRTYISIGILFCINLLNYMDRYTIAGVLTDIQAFYKINDAQGGLLQTVFMIFFMICSPVCGFLGDRYVRKWIIAVGIVVWVAAVLASTFIPANLFWLFLLFRGIVGVGEASYAVITPSIIADMFTGETRSRMLMFFYFAIPCGSGMGFMVGSAVASLTGDWRWGVSGSKNSPTYVFSTAGYTAIVFVVGTLTWWAPTAIEHNYDIKHPSNGTDANDNGAQVNLVFGALTCIGGIAGVAIGSMLSSFLRTGFGPFRYVQTVRSDAVVCGLGALIAVPSLYFALHEIPHSMTVCWILMFITITTTCFNWATNVDMLIAVVIPSRRNVANSWQILLSHMFGDASGPYIIGLISDAIRGDDDTPEGHFHSLIVSFYLPNVLLVVSAVLFFIAAYTFVRDQKKFQREMGVLSASKSSIENSQSSSMRSHVNKAFSDETTKM